MSKWRPPWHYSSAHDACGEAVGLLDWRKKLKSRTVRAPGPEMAALDENLSGEEYPLFDPLPQIAHGLPVIDFGAHVGSAAVYFEEMLDPNTVLCYEPSPTAFEYLLKNTGPNAFCTQAAIGAATGRFKYIERTPIFTSTCIASKAGGKSLEIDMVGAPHAFDRIDGEIGVLKIDIEGAELSALVSLGTSRLKRCRIIFLEYHHEMLRRMIDPLLIDFHLFHSHTFDDAWWGQGTVGYVRRDFSLDLEKWQ